MNVCKHKIRGDHKIKITKGSSAKIEHLHGERGDGYGAYDNSGFVHSLRDKEWVEVEVSEGSVVVGGDPKWYCDSVTLKAGEKAVVYCHVTGDAASLASLRVYTLD